MDVRIQLAQRQLAAAPTFQNQQALDRFYAQAGYKQCYVECKRCDSETRCERSHGSAMLCGECGGQGWTDIEWVSVEN